MSKILNYDVTGVNTDLLQKQIHVYFGLRPLPLPPSNPLSSDASLCFRHQYTDSYSHSMVLWQCYTYFIEH